MQLVKKCLTVLPLLWCMTAFAATDDDGFGFDDLDAVEATEQQELLQMAKEAAREYKFSKAQSLIKQAEHKAYAPDAVKRAKQVLASAEKKKKREDEEKARLAEEKRQRELAEQRRRASSSAGSTYVVDWGTSFQSGNSIWGRHGVRLNNGRKVYMWLEKDTTGFKCFRLSIQGSFYGGGSLCDDSIESYSSWAASCDGSGGRFWVKGDHMAVVKEIVSRCGGY